MKTNEEIVFEHAFQQLLMDGAACGMDLCGMTELCLLELAKHYIAAHGDEEQGLAHLSGHLETIDLGENETIH